MEVHKFINKAVRNTCSAAFFFILTISVWGQTTVLYGPASPTVGPFPTNVLTMPDPGQKTGLRVDLPATFDYCDPSLSPSVCSNVALLNQLDGFSINPRIMVCFSAAIDPNTLAGGISIVPIANPQAAVSINQILYDSSSNCAFAKPNQVLNQQSQYVLLVTNSVHDSSGQSVTADSTFTACISGSPDAYCAGLSSALRQINQQTGALAGASLFTTLSATTWLEQARQFVDAHQLPVVLPAGLPSAFALSKIKHMAWYPQGNSSIPSQDIPLSPLSGVQTIAFGLYLSPNFLNPSNGTIAATPTNTPITAPVPTPTAPLGYARISFHVFLPATPKPRGGFPVVIYGHGLGDNQFGAPTYIAGTLAKKGFATLALEIPGNGYGPGSTVRLTDTLGIQHTVSTPGRGILIPGNSQIGPADGCIVPGAVAIRDCGRQTAVDLFALVKTIQLTNGLGMNLDPNRIYYVGQSFGTTYGTPFHAVEPRVAAAVFNGDGGTSVDVARLAISGRPLAIDYLASINPALLNAPPPAYFNDDYVFRDQPPLLVTAPADGSARPTTLQAAFEAAEWVGMSGDPLSYAPHLKSSPLAGVPAKNTMFQFGYGDLEMPNPTESAIIRAANGQPTSWFLRFDKIADPSSPNFHPELLSLTSPGVGFPILPHRALSNETIFDPAIPAETSIALAEQQQVAAYFASNGQSNPDPNQFLSGAFQPASKLFEVPTTLPESLNFLIPVPW